MTVFHNIEKINIILPLRSPSQCVSFHRCKRKKIGQSRSIAKGNRKFNPKGISEKCHLYSADKHSVFIFCIYKDMQVILEIGNLLAKNLSINLFTRKQIKIDRLAMSDMKSAQKELLPLLGTLRKDYGLV